MKVVVANPTGRPVSPLDVVGELFGERREAHVVQGVEPGGAVEVGLHFEAEGVPPGLHALTLQLEHPVEGATDAAGSPPVESQLAYLPVVLGPDPGPAVRIEAECPTETAGGGCVETIGVRGEMTVHFESADGEAHSVRVRAVIARGVRAEGTADHVEVPARGATTVQIPLARAGGVPGSRRDVLLVAETVDHLPAQTTVQALQVEIASSPSLVVRLRWPVLALGLLLVASAGWAEWRRSCR